MHVRMGRERNARIHDQNETTYPGTAELPRLYPSTETIGDEQAGGGSAADLAEGAPHAEGSVGRTSDTAPDDETVGRVPAV
jgi:hypothetical protein